MIDSVAREILVKTKRKVFSANLGNNATTFLGNGLDFSEIREYNIGDDVRKINWKATAKSASTPYVNLFTEERELHVIVAFMTSGSISFGSKRIKQELMSEILALLGYSVMKNSDRLSTLFFSNKEEYQHKSTKNIAALHEIIPKALSLEVEGKSVDYKAFTDYILSRFKQPSLLFLIGDFYEELDLSLLSAKHELYTIIVRDHFEENPQLLGEINLYDPNTKLESELDIDSDMVERFKKEIEKKDKKLIEHFKAHDIRYTKIYTDEDPFYKLNNLVR
jgi:uncharacterized protein (DUF58 family)